MIRVGYIGVSHWHLRFYLEPVLALDTATVVAVADPDPTVANRIASHANAKAYVDYRKMCEEERPDFVFALGRHVDMASAVRLLLSLRIPFAVEKPAAASTAELADLVRLQADSQSFAAVSFPWRQSQLADILLERASRQSLRYVMFRRLLGPPTRYIEWGSPWMLDHRLAAGGCTLNLSVHWLDLFAHVTPDRPVEVSSAFMSNRAYGLSVEDYSLVTLEAGRSSCVVETGYLFPGGKFDMHFSAKSDTDYITVEGDGSTRVYGNDGAVESMVIPVNQDYPSYVRDILDRWQSGRPPDAGLGDMLGVLRIVEAAYAKAGWSAGS